MKVKKAILTGGGRATRLHPITTTINKHLLPLANKPMIFHAIEKAAAAGIEQIAINLNPGEKEMQKHIGDGARWGVKIEYFEQTGGPQGIAHVVNEARRFVGRDPFMFYLSDNVLLGGLDTFVDEFNRGKHDCMLALSQVEDARSFGVPVFDSANRLIDVLEKPENPPNNYAVTGIYLYGSNVFFDAFDRIEKSARGEYEISDIHSLFLREGKSVGYKEITGWWKDTGKAPDLLVANQLLLDQLTDQDFPNHGMVDESAVIRGNVHVGIGSRIGKHVTIHGPAIVGENCVLENCVIGPHATIGSGVTIKNATVRNSIVLDNAEIDASMTITDSLLGKQVKLLQHNNTPEGHRMVIGDKTVIEM